MGHLNSKHAPRLLAALLCLGTGLSAAEPVPIVHPGNAASAVSVDDLRRIYLGKSGTLADGTAVVPVDQATGTPSRQAFYTRFIDKSESQVTAYWSRLIFTGKGQPPQAVGDDAAVKKWVAGHPDAIGYIDDSAVDASVKVLQVR
ncbi:MAG: phosphate ABC transporter substrate-binding protein [Pseudomonadota bacterium]